MGKDGLDITVGAAAATLPWWALTIQNWLVWVGALAGAIIAVVRLYMLMRELWAKHHARIEE